MTAVYVLWFPVYTHKKTLLPGLQSTLHSGMTLFQLGKVALDNLGTKARPVGVTSAPSICPSGLSVTSTSICSTVPHVLTSIKMLNKLWGQSQVLMPEELASWNLFLSSQHVGPGIGFRSSGVGVVGFTILPLLLLFIHNYVINDKSFIYPSYQILDAMSMVNHETV